MTKVLVLGAYGLIGSACARALRHAGCDVTGLGRSRASAQQAAPGAAWVIADVAQMSVADWRAAAAGIDVVVNAAGALQDGGKDDLRGVHATAPARLAEALAGGTTRIVQISAVGVTASADTEFMRTKADGDAAVRSSGLPYVILRPGLVIGPAAYGGTALLRAAAALPGIMPNVFPATPVQCVALDDVAAAVVAAAKGRVPAGTQADLVEAKARPMPEVIRALRNWLGLPPASVTLPVPSFALALTGRMADGLSALGWRSPLRTTALRVLAQGITGDPGPWQAAGGPPCRSLEDTLTALPATVQERWFARLWPLLPLAVGGLSLFWLLSGFIGLMYLDAAATVMTSRGYSSAVATISVVGGGIADIALGAAILWRPWARTACLGMAALAATYLLGGTVLTPDLWADPLGPMTKVLPAILLPLMTAAMLEAR